MHRALVRRVAVLATLGVGCVMPFVATGCGSGDGGGPASPRADSVTIAVQPALLAVPTSTPLAIALMRLVPVDSMDLTIGPPFGEVRLAIGGTSVVTPVPLTASFAIAGTTATRAYVVIELLDGGEPGRVQWSARSQPIALRRGTTTTLELTFGRGSLAGRGLAFSLAGGHERTLIVGDTTQVEYVSIDSRAVFVESSDTTVARVERGRVVRGVRAGRAWIVGAVGLRADSIALTVVAAPASLAIEPASTELASIGDTLGARAVARDLDGALNPAARLEWSVATADSLVLRALGGGRFVARGNGIATIEARVAAVPSVRASATVRVRQRVASVTLDPATMARRDTGEVGLLTATAHDARGHAIADAVWDWSGSGPSILSVRPGTGTASLTATGYGDITVIASTGGLADTSRVTVYPTVTQLSIGSDFSVTQGTTRRLTAVGRDPAGKQYAVAVTWRSSNPAIAEVDSAGLVAARAAGTTRIYASNAALRLETSVEVRVTAGITSIRIASGDGQPGQLGQYLALPLRVIVLDHASHPVAGVPVTWWNQSIPFETPVTITDENGIAENRWRADGYGRTTFLKATVTGTALSVTFTIPVNPGWFAPMFLYTDAPATTFSGYAFTTEPMLGLMDARDIRVAQGGGTARVEVESGNATLAGPTSVIIDSNGIARFPGLVLTGPPGVVKLRYVSPEGLYTYSREITIR